MDRLTKIFGFKWGPNAAAEWVMGALLTRGKTLAAAIGAAGNVDLTGPNGSSIIQCEGDSTLVVDVGMTGGATGDLTVVVNPVEVDEATIMPINIPPVQTVGPILNGGHVYAYYQYDVTALDAVRVRITNNNVGAQTVTAASWRLA